jgi:OmpA-OmpF porin, OOP family
MNRNRKWIAMSFALFCCLTASLVYGAMQNQKTTIKGLITQRAQENMTVKTADGESVAVRLTPDTTIEQPHGAFGMKKKHYDVTALVPGLKVEVHAVRGDNNKLMAQTVKFSGNSLQTANEIQAGLTPTKEEMQTQQQEIQADQQNISADQQKISANQQEITRQQQEIKDVNTRFSNLSDYNTQATAVAHFAVGSTKLSEADKTALQKLAQDAVSQTGYIVSVKGYADSSGNAKQNQQLSMERAEAVIEYLEQTGNIPIMHIVAPGAMGTSHPEASNETAQGRAENRRVEVKVLVNKGLAQK